MDLYNNKYTFRFLLFFLIFLFGKNGIGQTSIRGKVSDRETNEKIIGADITLLKDGDVIRNTTTDTNGNFSFKIDPGIYEMEFSKKGLPSEKLIEVIVMEGQTTEVNYQLFYERHMCGLVIRMRVQLAKTEKMEKGQSFVDKTFIAKPNREINQMILMTPGVTLSN